MAFHVDFNLSLVEVESSGELLLVSISNGFIVL